MLREGVPYEGAWFYSLTSSIYASIFALGLFLTDAYLLAGHSSYVPVYAVFTVAELIKYAYIQLTYYKDISDLGASEKLRKAVYNPKQGFKLVSIVFHLARQVRPAELLRGALVLGGVVCIVFVAAVLFGAEALARHRETLMFSCLVTVLTAFPVCLHQGVTGVFQLASGHRGTDAFSLVLLRNVQLTVLGAWLGAFVVPLDWDRPWQDWPVPSSLGALLGFAAAQMVSLGEIYSKHFRRSKAGGGKHR